MKYTVSQFLSYVQGWLDSEAAKADSLTMGNMESALHNALNCIEDPNDGIEWFVKRKEMQDYRFEGKHTAQFRTDSEAFDYALGWYDDRSATVEKWINKQWAPAADPVYQPEYFENGLNGGWVLPDKSLLVYDS